MNTNTSKTCNVCKHDWELEKFVNTANKSGYSKTCASCRLEKAQAWRRDYYEANKEKANQQTRDWQRKNPDRYREQSNAYKRRQNKANYAVSKEFWASYKGEDETLHNAVMRYALENYGQAEWNRTLWNGIELIETATNTQCWMWTKSLRNNGYPQSIVRLYGSTIRQSVMAHRLSYAYFYDLPPAGVHGPRSGSLVVDHLCGQKACINPFHMQLITHEENLSKALNGHHYTGDSVMHTTIEEAIAHAHAVLAEVAA